MKGGRVAGEARVRAAPRVGSGPHAAAAGAVPGLDLREPARGRQALLRPRGAIAAKIESKAASADTLPPPNPRVPRVGHVIIHPRQKQPNGTIAPDALADAP